MAVDTQESVPEQFTTSIPEGVVLPHVDIRDTASVTQFKDALNKIADQELYGSKGINRLLSDIQRFHKMVTDREALLRTKINRINGERVPRKSNGNSLRAQRNVALKFYKGLDQATLYNFAKAAKVNHAVYETDEALITAMVDVFMANKEQEETE